MSPQPSREVILDYLRSLLDEHPMVYGNDYWYGFRNAVEQLIEYVENS